MLEIIGWLGCLYLFVKGLEIIGNQSNRVKRFESEETRLSVPSIIAAGLAIAGAFVFPFILNAQANGVSSTSNGGFPSTLNQEQVDCINNASGDNAKILACTK